MFEIKKNQSKYFLTIIFASTFLFSFGILTQNVFADSVVATIATPNGSYGTGNIPLGVGVNTDTNMIYMANRGGFWGQGGAVFVIDGSTNSVVSKIQEESGPAGVAVNPITNKIYVTNAGYYTPSLHFIYSSTVSVIDGATNSITNTIAVRNEPSGVGVNPNTNEIYVANALNNTISVIDGSTNSVVNTVMVGSNPAFVAVNPNTNKIYVVDANGIEVIDGSTNSVVSVISGSYVALGVNPNTDKIYAINESSISISVIDGSTNNVVDTIPVGSNPEGITVNPSMNKIYVADSDSRTVSVIDGATDKIINTISLGYVPTGIGANTNTNMVYVAGYSNANGVAVLVIDGNNPPQSPTELTATAKVLQINLNWNAPSDNGGSAITGYMIERSTDNGNTWSTIVSNTDTTGTTYSDTNVQLLTTYTYRVSAINNVGTGNPSNTASATTPSVSIPSTPTLP